MDQKIFDEFANKVTGMMPPGAKSLQNEFEKNLKSAIEMAFSKLNLVTREEFDAQNKVLERTREKVTVLEQQIQELEKKILEPETQGS